MEHSGPVGLAKHERAPMAVSHAWYPLQGWGEASATPASWQRAEKLNAQQFILQARQSVLYLGRVG